MKLELIFLCMKLRLNFYNIESNQKSGCSGSLEEKKRFKKKEKNRKKEFLFCNFSLLRPIVITLGAYVLSKDKSCSLLLLFWCFFGGRGYLDLLTYFRILQATTIKLSSFFVKTTSVQF